MGFGYTNIPSNGIEDNYSIRFDGVGDYAGFVGTPQKSGWVPTNIHTNYSSAFWVKMADFSGTQIFGSHDDKRWYMGFSDAKAAIGVANAHNLSSAFTITPTPQVGEWLHFAVVADGGTATAYINSVAQGTMSYVQNAGTNPTGYCIGATYNGSGSISYAMNGKLSDIVNYKVALTPEQVETIYNGREPFDHNDWSLSHELETWYKCGDAKKGYLGNPIMIDSSKNTGFQTLGGEVDTTSGLYGSDDGPNLILFGDFIFGQTGWSTVDFTFTGHKAQCTTDGGEQSIQTALPFIEPDGGINHLFKLKYDVVQNSDSIQIKTGGKTNDFCDETNIPSTVGSHEIYIIGTNNGTSDEMTIFHAHSSSSETLEVDNFELTLYKNGKQFIADAAFSNEGGG